MPRVISVFLPTLPTDRVRRKAGDTAPPPEVPLILVGRDGRRRVVLAADVAAQSAGLRVGMPASKAQALVHGLVVKDADPTADGEALERLEAIHIEWLVALLGFEFMMLIGTDHPATREAAARSRAIFERIKAQHPENESNQHRQQREPEEDDKRAPAKEAVQRARLRGSFGYSWFLGQAHGSRLARFTIRPPRGATKALLPGSPAGRPRRAACPSAAG